MALNAAAESNLKLQQLEAVVIALAIATGQPTGKLKAFIDELEGDADEVLYSDPPPDQERQQRLSALQEGFFKKLRQEAEGL